ncbi:MAG: hypothetical protein RLZZ28_1293 [Bacteroidota bacterium]|jgi:aminoglycoside phosphotransferase (APT) family kinase protein
MDQHKNTTRLKEGECFNLEALNQYIQAYKPEIGNIEAVSRFTGGYSNLTYRLESAGKNYVLRMPPPGANIKSAHDMGREFKVLSLLKPVYQKLPNPLLYCDSAAITGAPFYIMEELAGIILRAGNAPDMNIDPAVFRQISAALTDNLVDLHALDINKTGLIQLGKPDGYVVRQVEGWIKRYYAAETDPIVTMNELAAWLQKNLPKNQSPTFLHNDYKYDNIILHPDKLTEILAVLDWEMSTVGDPLMDLGAMLAYWFEEGEEPVFKYYNLSWLPGNFSRKEIIEHYAMKSGRDLSDILFYYVFGLFKNAVIAQQIYHRWKQGYSKDARFGTLLPMIQLLGEKAAKALHSHHI